MKILNNEHYYCETGKELTYEAVTKRYPESYHIEAIDNGFVSFDNADEYNMWITQINKDK